MKRSAASIAPLPPQFAPLAQFAVGGGRARYAEQLTNGARCPMARARYELRHKVLKCARLHKSAPRNNRGALLSGAPPPLCAQPRLQWRGLGAATIGARAAGLTTPRAALRLPPARWFSSVKGENQLRKIGILGAVRACSP